MAKLPAQLTARKGTGMTDAEPLGVRGYLLHLTHYDPGWCPRKEEEQEFDLGPQIVPQDYNTTTTLEVEIVSGSNTHDFPLKKD